ncbi:MAG: LytR C-terminal domain-containing protein [Clostridia bacterium]|nr:LytR C-terminal domain-containing protein [Clostridia bacterium]
MNKGKFFNIVFMLTGTFILVTLIVIVSLNFVKDARIFQESVATAVQDPEAKTDKPAAQKAGNGDKDDGKQDPKISGTIKIEKSVKPEETEPKKTTEPAKDEKKEKVKVEVINYSGIKRVAEDIKTTLEASGYEVSAGNEKSNKPVRTEIIERNDKKAGAAIQKILKIAPVTKAPDPTSRFDVTIRIGDDYKP